MAQVAPAAPAGHLGAAHAVRGVLVQLHVGALRRLREAGPARPGVELRVRGEELGTARRALVHPCLLGVHVLAAERPLRALAAHDLVLLRRQALVPLGLGRGDLGCHGGPPFVGCPYRIPTGTTGSDPCVPPRVQVIRAPVRREWVMRCTIVLLVAVPALLGCTATDAVPGLPPRTDDAPRPPAP